MAIESVEAVEAVEGLVWLTDEGPGIRRVRHGRGFRYVTPTGRPANAAQRARIQALAIPPAWTDVWISPKPDGHLQATGIDDRGRKQYRYHPDWRTARDREKFARLGAFGEGLVALRRAVRADLDRPGLPQEKVVALAVRLLDETLMRIGNRCYERDNGSYGLTTLRPDAIEVDGSGDDATVAFAFTAKSGIERGLRLADPEVASLLDRLQQISGPCLLSYERDDGSTGTVTSDVVNAYLDERMDGTGTAKDFRTWGGTVSAAAALALTPVPERARAVDQVVLSAYDIAAELLGNTRAVCRASYVHPVVEEAYRSGALSTAWRTSRSTAWLSRPERLVLRLLRSDAAAG